MQIELQTSINILHNITGKNPKVFRPPFGAYNNALIETAKAWFKNNTMGCGLARLERLHRPTNRPKGNIKNQKGSIILIITAKTRPKR